MNAVERQEWVNSAESDETVLEVVGELKRHIPAESAWLAAKACYVAGAAHALLYAARRMREKA